MASKFFQNLRVVNLTTTSTCEVPNLPSNDNSTKAANTSFVQAAIAAIQPGENILQTDNTFTGTNTFQNDTIVPTQSSSDDSGKAANTSFVQSRIAQIPAPQSLLSTANTWTNGQTFNSGFSSLCANNGTAAQFVASSGYTNNGLYLQNVAINQQNVNQPNFSNTLLGININQANSSLSLGPSVNLKFRTSVNNLSYFFEQGNGNLGIVYANTNNDPATETPLLLFTPTNVQYIPTIASNDSSTQVATTQWAQNLVNASIQNFLDDQNVWTGTNQFGSGIYVATLPNDSNSTQAASTAFVQNVVASILKTNPGTTTYTVNSYFCTNPYSTNQIPSSKYPTSDYPPYAEYFAWFYFNIGQNLNDFYLLTTVPDTAQQLPAGLNLLSSTQLTTAPNLADTQDIGNYTYLIYPPSLTSNTIQSQAIWPWLNASYFSAVSFFSFTSLPFNVTIGLPTANSAATLTGVRWTFSNSSQYTLYLTAQEASFLGCNTKTFSVGFGEAVTLVPIGNSGLISWANYQPSTVVSGWQIVTAY